MAQNQPWPPILDEFPTRVIFLELQSWLPFWETPMVDGPQESCGVACGQAQKAWAGAC